MDSQTATAVAPAGDAAPDWWPYAQEFPHWRVWRGVAGLMYARRLKASPPRVVRAWDEVTLREKIRQAEFARLRRWARRGGSGPGGVGES